MLTLKQVAERSGIGPSLAAFYRDKYEEYLKSSGEGRHRKYDESNVELFKLIAQRYKEGHDYEQIKQELDNKYGILVEDNKTKAVQQEDLMQSIKGELVRRDMIILELQQELKSIKESMNRIENNTRNQEGRDEEIMFMMREIIKQKQNKWWKRIFKKG